MIVHLRQERKPGDPGPRGGAAWSTCCRSTRPASATGVTWRTTGTSAWSSTRSGTSTGSARWPPSWGCGSPMSPRRTSTTTTSPAAWPWPRRPARHTWSTRPTRSRFARTPVTTATACRVSEALGLRVMATPGHTFTHLAYVLETDGEVAGVFTGGSLLYGSTGRPDLLGPEHTAGARPGPVRLRPPAGQPNCPDTAPVFPTHGFGSFCAATQSGGRVLHDRPREAGEPGADPGRARATWRPCWPAWTRGPPTTRTWPRPTRPGPPAADLSPPRRADPAELRRRIEAGEWVVDLRDRMAFAAGFLPGSVSFPLDGSFATYLGWAAALGRAADPARRDPGPGRHRRSGNWPGSASTGPPRRPPAGPRTGPPAAAGHLAAAGQVRRPGRRLGRRRTPAGRAGRPPPLEWAESHIAGAVHIPLHELPGRLGELPAGRGLGALPERVPRDRWPRPCWPRRGRQVVGVDDDFGNAGTAGLPLVQD